MDDVSVEHPLDVPLITKREVKCQVNKPKNINMVVANYAYTDEYDVVIAGGIFQGGATACVVAGRLAAADPSLSILLIESGKNSYNDPTVRNPVMLLSHLAPGSKTAMFYKAKPSEHLLGREAVIPAGNVLGGGSSINFMLYTRAQGVDFDSWETEGWYQDDMLPLLNKMETYHCLRPGVDKSKHGYHGPIHITKRFRELEAENEWMRVAKSMGESEFADLQDLQSCGGWSRWARYVSPDGKRQDTAHCYVHPLLQGGNHPNLHVLVETLVQKVIFDDQKRAIGVEITPNPAFQATIGLSQHPTGIVKARKMVISSCGPLGSPLLLERSGIGGSQILNEIGVSVVSDLPGVGENLQDHHLLLYPYKTSLGPDQTIDGILSGRVSLADALDEKNPMRTWNAGDVSSKLRPTQEEVDTIGGELKQLWDRDFKNQPSRPFMLCALHNCYLGNHSTVPDGQYMTVATYTAYPYSRGSIHAKGKTASSPHDLDTGFLNRKLDVDALVWAYKRSREIIRRTNYYRGELPVSHPEFPSGSNAALADLAISPNEMGTQAVKNLTYTKEDDAAIERHIRLNVNTTWHSLGTCAMRPREQGGVVDKKLNVHGVSNLKVADLSIPPENVGANTYNTALAIGEKAALLIAAELGIFEF
ncbi:hypothetical protein H2200_004177 [Cladophialophora chaetospira]|uniref:Glucose-methanol-choline oxidoreductase N-terminal domain-containing protein n=1 Tax=Cladophialophora chaetospira TaxID=386627 RepID=A0AA38XFL9_9EURO|nr:hypothetical protein H2200_004177 [Cladophialophora chaetospira]